MIRLQRPGEERTAPGRRACRERTATVTLPLTVERDPEAIGIGRPWEGGGILEAANS